MLTTATWKVYVFSCLKQILVLFMKSVTGEGVATLIENSPKLIVFHLCTDYISFVGTTFSPEIFEVILKKKFSSRKLYCCDSYKL